MEQENVCVNHESVKGLIFKIHKKFKPRTKKNNLKRANEFKQTISAKMIHKKPKSI